MSATLTTLAPPARSQDTRVISLITLAHGFSHFYQLLIPSLFVYISRDLGLSYTQLGVLLTLFFGASGVGQVLAGFAVDRLGARNLLLFGLALSAASHVIAGGASTFTGLALCAFFAGAGNSVFHPADFSLLSGLVSPPRLPWAFSFHGIGGNIGYVVSPTFAVAATSAFGWRNAAWIAGGLGILLALYLFIDPTLKRMPSTTRAPSPTANAAGSLFKPLLNPVIFAAFGFFCVATFYSTAINAFGAAIFRDYHHIAVEPAVLLVTVYLVAQTVGIVIGGFVGASGRSPGQTASRATLLASALAAILLIPDLPMIAIAIVLSAVGVANGVVGPSRDLIVKRAAPKEAIGRAYGVVYSGFDIGASIVPIAYGALIDLRLAWVLIVCIVLSFLLNAYIAAWLDRQLIQKS
jgi:MFS transporter, FSR family, fosmidomycin resistance protein